MKKSEKIFFMKRALTLAEKGRSRVSPNPLVGAIVVKNSKIIAEGYHRTYGGPHAERVALLRAGREAKDASLFVTLEPCSHFGKTPPCTDLVIRSGIKRLYVGAFDLNKMNRHPRLRAFAKTHIRIEGGILAKECRRQNRGFFMYHKKKRPYVILKLAQSLDGKIATKSGDSKWISSHESRREVHLLRRTVDAVLVGINTIMRDDPLLSARHHRGKPYAHQPAKIVLDAHLKTPTQAKIFSKNSPGKVFIITSHLSSRRLKDRLIRWGATIITLRERAGKLPVEKILGSLAKEGMREILIEGGAEVAGSFIDKKLVDEFIFFMAPVIIGGRHSVTSIAGQGARSVKSALPVNHIEWTASKTDFIIRGRLTDYV